MGERRFAFITGANKGIGLATARELVAEKMDMHFVMLDVTKQETIETACIQIERDAGLLDILINNAGISVEPAAQSTLDGLRRTYETNVWGIE